MNYRSILVAMAQTLGLFAARFVIPVLGDVLALFTPVPLILVYVRNGKQDGVITLIASSFAIGLLFGWQAAVIVLFSFGLMAVAISEGMRRQWKHESSILTGALLPIAALGITTAFYIVQSGKDPILMVEAYLRENMAQAAAFYTQMGLKEMATAISSFSDSFIYYFVRLIPGIMIASSLFQAACCYSVCRTIVLRRPGTAPALTKTDFPGWFAPDSWVWGLIAALALVMFPGDAPRFTGLNLSILYAVLYLVQGTAIVEHYLRKVRIQSFIRGLIHTILLGLPSIVFVIALGVVDIWADFRKLRVPVEKV